MSSDVVAYFFHRSKPLLTFCIYTLSPLGSDEQLTPLGSVEQLSPLDFVEQVKNARLFIIINLCKTASRRVSGVGDGCQ